MKRSNNFTLVEIIAVLLIIAIMAAVAAPKFISLADDAKAGIAQAGVNEACATLSVAYVKAYLDANKAVTVAAPTKPTITAVLAAAGAAGGTVVFGDVTVTFTDADPKITLSGDYQGVTAAGEWTLPAL